MSYMFGKGVCTPLFTTVCVFPYSGTGSFPWDPTQEGFSVKDRPKNFYFFFLKRRWWEGLMNEINLTLPLLFLKKGEKQR